MLAEIINRREVLESIKETEVVLFDLTEACKLYRQGVENGDASAIAEAQKVFYEHTDGYWRKFVVDRPEEIETEDEE